ncbi:conserved protein, unknown function [Hepatocystis sp. ex Piliocolobus tephrosceles]|nr:conserved protein, unknown function [Hepatocystis sp. ex Piliocolobus tephrosceles]
MYLALYIVVGFLWGFSNVYLKKGCIKNEKKKKSKNIDDSMLSMLSNINFITSYFLNNIGSVLYYYLLYKSDISLAMPLANTSSFIFTYITEVIILKKKVSYKSALGLVLICAGLFLCLKT